MKSKALFKRSAWPNISALTLALLLAVVATGEARAVQHGQHDGHVQPARKSTTKKTKKTTKRAPNKRADAPARTAPSRPDPTTGAPSTHNTHGTHNAAQPAPTPQATETQRETPASPPPAQPQSDHTTHTQHVAPAKPAEAAPTSPASPATTPPVQDTHGGHTGHPTKEQPKPVDATPLPQQQAMPPARHDGHTGQDDTARPAPANDGNAADDTKSALTVDVDDLMVMSEDGDMGVRVGRSESNYTPMGQMGSGTAWQPSTSPMYMIHQRAGDWLLMYHWNATVGVNSQGGPRGVTKFESMNWLMPMAYRRVGNGTLQLRGMFSFEPFTFPPGGSPLLFQTGETYKGRPIVDAQHPHDLFMELSAQYTMPLGERGTWFAYVGMPGEPALGPVAFMHRASASENPSAVLSHHYQDSSHISYGVFTTGFTYRWLKLEGSFFNGREPDEDRYGLEFNPWNSRSARLSIAPNKNWTFQVSHGFLRNPEALEPGDVRRTTASAQYNRAFDRGNLALAFVWGRNHESHDGEVFNLNGYVGEATVNFIDKNYLYTRLELADRRGILREPDLERLGFDHHDHPIFRVGAYTFGYVRDVWKTDKLSVGLGGDVTFYSKPAALDAIYGQHPTSYKIFLRLRPGRMQMDHGGHGATTTTTTHGNH